MRNRGFILLLVGLALTTEIGCRKAPPAEATAAPEAGAGGLIVLPPDSPLLEQVRVETVQAAPVSLNEVSAPGQIDFDVSRVGRVHVPAAGRVATVAVRLGDSVRAGQPVMTVDSPEAEDAVSAYRQALSAAVQSRANLAKVTADRNRANDLFEHKAASRKDVMAAENELAVAQASVDQTEAAREQARRRLEILGLDRTSPSSRMTVTAPLTGKVIELSVSAGEYLSDVSTPVMTVADLSTVWVTSEIPETSIRLIEPGERIELELIAYPGETFQARVTRIADVLDPKTRTVQVRAELPNPSGRLRPGMFGRIRHMHEAGSFPVVPAGAVYRRGAASCLFVERGRGRFERVEVRLGAESGLRIPVLRGLAAGDRVAVEGVMFLAGMEIR